MRTQLGKPKTDRTTISPKTVFISILGVLIVIALLPTSGGSSRFLESASQTPKARAYGEGCAHNCNSRGTCMDGRCICKLGWGGPDCRFSLIELYGQSSVYHGFQGDSNFRATDLTGWSPGHEVYHELLDEVNAVTVIEVGVWKGLSAAHMAHWLKNENQGLLIAIDTWLGAPEFWGKDQMGGNDEKRGLFLKNGWPTIFYSFLSNMVHEGLEKVAVPLPLPSAQAATVLRMRNMTAADLVHIDASHEYGPVTEDIHIWWHFVRPGGILLGDDYSSSWPGVKNAVNHFAANCNLQMELRATKKWILRKPVDPPIGLPDICYHPNEEYFSGAKYNF